MANTVISALPKQKILRRISRGNQVTLPPRFLKENDLHIGDTVEFIEETGRVTIQPMITAEALDKSRLIQKIQDLFFQMDTQIPEEKRVKDEQEALQVIDQEINLFRKKPLR